MTTGRIITRSAPALPGSVACEARRIGGGCFEALTIRRLDWRTRFRP